MRSSGERELSDNRILGSGEFVERIIKEAEANIRYQFPARDEPEKINEFIAKVCKYAKVSIRELKSGRRRKEVSGVRALIATGLVKKHGVTFAEGTRRVGVSTTAVSKIIKRAKY